MPLKRSQKHVAALHECMHAAEAAAASRQLASSSTANALTLVPSSVSHWSTAMIINALQYINA